MFPTMKGPSPACTFLAFLYVTTPIFSACIFCCVALNLQLVLIHGVSGNKMEKYYLFAAALLCGACNIPPLIAGELGWYAPLGICWLRVPTPAVQQHWMVGTQSVPMILMSAVEFFSFMNILIFMLLQLASVQNSQSLLLAAHIFDQLSIQRLRTKTSGSAIATLASMNPKHPMVKFRLIIVRIGLLQYLPQCVYISMYRTPSTFHTNLRILNTYVYSIRPLLYALLAATDPWVPSPRSHSQTATTVSFQWASKQQLGKSSRTSIIAYEPSSARDCERRSSTAEEARTEGELRLEKIPHQL
ncbi:hypothetical protein B0H13DRAFT_2289153 [Mycena leptocephala]|nr:hypothetical protein B0H13DRAFT_2289153 [Mycena leptocephala]